MPLSPPAFTRPPAPLRGAAPSWAAAALGAHLWDAHGRIHLDMSCANGAALLGHAEPRVEAAAADPSPAAPALAAEALGVRWAGARSVRFTATADAAREAATALAVRATDRLEVVTASSRQQLALAPERLAEAAALLVPAEVEPAVLHQARALAAAAGALLIIDETTIGLRRPPPAARADLVIGGPGIANGRPIGALAGEPELLAHLPDLPPASPAALAAAAATLAITASEDAPLQLAVRGAEIQAELEAVFAEARSGDVVHVGGDPTAIALTFGGREAPRVRRRFLAQLAARGVHAPGVLHASTQHGHAEIGALLDAVAAAAPLLIQASAEAA